MGYVSWASDVQNELIGLKTTKLAPGENRCTVIRLVHAWRMQCYLDLGNTSCHGQ
jgi:hypothetical protein